MKLYDYLELMKDFDELTVWDEVYDIETYFYSEHISDSKWNNAMDELAKLLTIKEIREHGVVVNLTELVENKMEEITDKEMFYEDYCNIDYIMCNMDRIIAGNVSENWFVEFVNILKG